MTTVTTTSSTQHPLLSGLLRAFVAFMVLTLLAGLMGGAGSPEVMLALLLAVVVGIAPEAWRRRNR